MQIRRLVLSDANKYLELKLQLDNETDFMLYEVNERDSSVEDIEKEILELNKLNSLALVVEDKGKLVGYILAERGFANRTEHSVYITIGILESYHGMGLGSVLFNRLIDWAKSNGVIRLELTVMTHNKSAIKLYEKVGFKVEGLKEKSLLVNKKYVDEYYMALILKGAI